MNRTNKRRLAAAPIILLLLLLLGGAVDRIIDPPDDPKAECAEEVKFFSTDVEKNFFGPPAEGDNVVELKDELRDRRCADPMLVVAHAHAWGMDGYGSLEGDAQFSAAIANLANHPAEWRKVIRGIERNEKASEASIANMSGPYQTLYALDTAYGPLIRKAAPDRPSFKVLRFRGQGGRTVNLKLDCGFQPVAQEFPGVPPVKNPPTTTTTTTTVPGCPPGTVPYGDRCVKEPSDDGSGGNDRPVSQPVDEHPQGPTPGAQTEDPPPVVRPEGDPNGSNGNGGAAPPTVSDDNSDANQVTQAPPPGEDPCPLGPGNC